MKYKIKTYMILLILTLGMGLSTINIQTSQAQEATEAKIGLLAPLSGELGDLGPSFENAANLAVKHLNANQSDYNFQLIVQDTESNDEAGANAMTSLADEGVAGVVGAAGSGVTLAASEVAKSNQIPMVSYASTSPAITDTDDGDFLFRVVPTDALQGIALSDLVSNDSNSKVAIIALDNAYGQGLSASFSDNFNGTVVTTSSYQANNRDFSSIVSNIKQSEADSIVMISYVEDGGAILEELATQDVNLQIYGTDGIQSTEVFTHVSDNDYFKGVKGTTPKVKNDTDFNEAFFNEYDEEVTVFVPQAYDATQIIGKAVMEAGSTTACEVANEIRTIGTEYQGVSGTVTFDSNGDQIATSYDYWRATNESLEVLGTFTPPASAGATGDVPDDHCSSGLFNIPFSSASLYLSLVFMGVVAFVVRRKKVQ